MSDWKKTFVQSGRRRRIRDKKIRPLPHPSDFESVLAEPASDAYLEYICKRKRNIEYWRTGLNQLIQEYLGENAASRSGDVVAFQSLQETEAAHLYGAFGHRFHAIAATPRLLWEARRRYPTIRSSCIDELILDRVFAVGTNWIFTDTLPFTKDPLAWIAAAENSRGWICINDCSIPDMGISEVDRDGIWQIMRQNYNCLLYVTKTLFTPAIWLPVDEKLWTIIKNQRILTIAFLPKTWSEPPALETLLSTSEKH